MPRRKNADTAPIVALPDDVNPADDVNTNPPADADDVNASDSNATTPANASDSKPDATPPEDDAAPPTGDKPADPPADALPVEIMPRVEAPAFKESTLTADAQKHAHKYCASYHKATAQVGADSRLRRHRLQRPGRATQGVNVLWG